MQTSSYTGAYAARPSLRTCTSCILMYRVCSTLLWYTFVLLLLVSALLHMPYIPFQFL